MVGEVIQTAGSEAAVFLLLFRKYKGKTAGILSQLEAEKGISDVKSEISNLRFEIPIRPQLAQNAGCFTF